MATMMSVALPVLAIAGAGLTGGASLGLLGATTLGVSTAAIGTGLAAAGSIGGTALSAYGAKEAGDAQQKEGNFVAAEDTANADEAQAGASAKVAQQTQQTKYAISNAQAAAAAGGGSATDPTVTTNLATIAAQGKYRALTDMYAGNSAAQADLTSAAAARFGGQQAAQAGTTKMYSDLMNGGGSLLQKYGNIKASDNSSTTPYPPLTMAQMNGGGQL